MKPRKLIAGLLMVSIMAATACTEVTPTDVVNTDVTGEVSGSVNTSYAGKTPEEICATLSLEQKAAQMMIS